MSILCGTAAAAPAATSAAALANQLRSVAMQSSASSGFYVYDITAKRSLFKLRPKTRRILASNTKLFTTAAALSRGADAGIETAVYGVGTLNAGIFTGDLYLRGSGDPLLGSDAFNKRYYGTGSDIETLAQTVADVGVTSVTGRIYGDETVFDSKRGTAYSGFRRGGDIGGSLSGLSFNRGLANLAGSSFQSDQPRFAAARLISALEDNDVKVAGSAGKKVTPSNPAKVAGVVSPTLARIAALTNKPSDNFLAEMLLKWVGNAGTTASGAAAARKFARSLGSSAAVADGSGLSRGNRASPAAVIRLLRGMYEQPAVVASAYSGSLAIPGGSGTLSKRMRGTPAASRCAAKTGTLSNVSALSGYCESASGHRLAFSFLMNAVWPGSARKLQDRMTVMLAKYEG